jgi:hypothetical protein
LLYSSRFDLKEFISIISLFRQGSDEESNNPQSQRRLINKRRVCLKEIFKH